METSTSKVNIEITTATSTTMEATKTESGGPPPSAITAGQPFFVKSSSSPVSDVQITDNTTTNAEPILGGPWQFIDKIRAKIPLCRNRWVCAGVYFVTIFFTSCIYFGWQGYAQLIYRSGAYAWRCDGHVSTPEEMEDLPENAICKAQADAISTMYSVASAAEYSIGVVAGVFLDQLGPRACASIGELCFFLGMLCVAFASRSTASYIPGMLLLGGATNLVAFPAMVLADIFPRHSGVAIALCLAAQNLLTVLPQIILKIWDAHPTWSLRGIHLIYLPVFWLPLTCIYILFLPTRRPRAAKATENVSTPSKTAETEKNAECDRQDTAASIRSDTTMLPHPPANKPSRWTLAKQDFKALSVDLQTWEYWAFTLYYATQIWQYVYYATTIAGYLGDDVSNFVGWTMPAQAAVTLLAGHMFDKFQTPLVAIGSNLAVFLMYFLCIWRTTAVNYLSGVLYLIANAIIYTTKYTFVTEKYDNVNFGKLAGLIGLFGGLSSLLSIPVVESTAPIRSWYIVMAIVAAALMIPLGLVWLHHKKTYKRKVSGDLDQLKDGSGDFSPLEVERSGIIVATQN